MKNTKITALAAAMLMLTAATGCGINPGGFSGIGKAELLTPNQVSADTLTSTCPDENFMQAQTAFALSLMQHASETRAGKNLLLSPYSLMQALAMTANGAAGETRSEMEQVLGGIPLEQLNSGLYNERMNARTKALTTANSIWYRDENGFVPKQDFLQTAAGYYGAEAYKAPFDDSTLAAVNNWCKEKTDGMIPEITDRIRTETAMILLNAVCFDAKWVEPFENPGTGTFQAASGAVQDVTMLRSTETAYLQDLHASGFIKPYESGYSFAAILPETGMTPEEYLAQQTPEGLRGMLTGAKNTDVEIALPAFSLADKMQLNGTLSEMGMQKAFDDADFSAMADGIDDLAIGEVLQKTYIDVNASGTKAAAATEVEVDSCAPPAPEYSVILNRPFVYMILDSDTMLPVFTGILNSAQS